MSRPIIMEMASILEGRNDSASAALIELLESQLLTKPQEHTGDSSTDYFGTTGLSDDNLKNICDHLFDAEADAVPTSGETTREASKIASLVDHWVDAYFFSSFGSPKLRR